MYSLSGRKKDYGYYKCRLKIFWIGAVISLLVTLPVVLWIALTPPQTGAKLQLTPTDTQLIAFSYSFCDGSTLKNVQNSPYNCSMFLTIDQPPLTTSNSFTVSFHGTLMNETASGHYKSWFYQLNSGSTVTVNGCVLSDGGSVSFFLIQGTSNYNKWLASPDNSYALFTHEVSMCEGSTPNLIEQYTSKTSDTYYFVLYSTLADIHVEMDMSFDRTQYNLQGIQGLPNCTVLDAASCNLGVPLSTYQYVLVTFNDAGDSVIGSYYQWEWTCEPRIWVYTMIVVGPTAFSFFLPLIIILACMYYWKGRESHWYNQIEKQMPPNLVQGWIGDNPT